MKMLARALALSMLLAAPPIAPTVHAADAPCAAKSPGATATTPTKEAMRRRVYVMRHGEAAYFDADGKPVANTDIVGLTERGVAQARAAGRWFCDAGIGHFDVVIASPFPRAQQTAHEVLATMGDRTTAQAWNEFRELDAGTIDAQTTPDPAARERAFLAFGQAAVGPGERLFGGESVAEARARIVPSLDRLYEQRGWDTALIVAHSGVNSVILSEALTGSDSLLGRLELGTACISVLDLGPKPREWVVRAVNLCPDPAIYDVRSTSWERNRDRSMK